VPPADRRGVHILIVQDGDGRLVVGDSHEYARTDFPPALNADTERLILREAQKLVAFPLGAVAERWHGVYPLHATQPVYSTTLDDRIHVLTAIGGKGMTTGPALARETINRLFGPDDRAADTARSAAAHQHALS
jgi:D-hydroxyproline dehydrogenase subunit beta